MTEVAQEAEDEAHVGDGVLVEVMEGDQGVEDQEPQLGAESPSGANRS